MKKILLVCFATLGITACGDDVQKKSSTPNSSNPANASNSVNSSTNSANSLNSTNNVNSTNNANSTNNVNSTNNANSTNNLNSTNNANSTNNLNNTNNQPPNNMMVLATCNEVGQCVDMCREGDEACFERCLNNATMEAQQAYIDLFVCVQDFCIGIADQEEFALCLFENCQAEVDACSE